MILKSARTSRRPPSPPRFYRLREVLANPLYIRNVLLEYGDFMLWKGLSDLYFVNHPDYLRQLLSRGNEHFSKQTVDYRILAQYMGKGLVCSDGALWSKQRRIIEPFFAQKNQKRFDQAINDITATLVDDWNDLPGDEPIWLDREMQRLTLRIAGVTMFGLALEPHIDRINEVIAVVNRHPRNIRPQLTVYPWLPVPYNFKMARARKQLDRIVYGLIRDRRRKSSGGHDILHRLIHEPDAREAGDRQTRDEIVTFLLSGHATTASALGWTLHLIASHPDVEAQLVDSLAARLNGSPATADDLARVPYLQHVVLESLRLYPPAWCFSRRSEQEHEFGGHVLPAKAPVAVSVHALHRHPDFWPDADRFDPDRFQPNRSKKRHFFAYLPFAAGPRTCVGGGMAMLQIQLVLAQILQRFRIRAVPDHPVEAMGRVTLEPRYGLPATLTPR